MIDSERKVREKRTKIRFVFMDIQNSFERVKWDKSMDILKEKKTGKAEV